MKFKNISLILAIVFLAVGVGAMFMDGQGSMAGIIQGLAKGLAGVFFVLCYI